MKKMISVLLASVLVFTMAACGSAGNSNSADTQESAPANDVNTQQSSGSVDMDSDSASNEDASDLDSSTVTDDDGSNILVVYFSWSGHLDSMAHWVADETGGDLVRVTAKEPYPENYNDTADRAKAEQDNDERPEITVDLTAEQMAQYDTVYFGFPVWWYDLPMCMWTFLEGYDFSGKTIIPFFSHEGSSNGAGGLPRIESLATGATVRSDDALSIRGGSVDKSEEEVREWVRNLGY